MSDMFLASNCFDGRGAHPAVRGCTVVLREPVLIVRCKGEDFPRAIATYETKFDSESEAWQWCAQQIDRMIDHLSEQSEDCLHTATRTEAAT